MNPAQYLPLGSIKPRGWLLEQLKIQADGLCGHLDEFWKDVADSGWFGGSSEGWERAPYWLDGLVPLAWGLNDEKLIFKATEKLNYIIYNQLEDGWLGPRDAKAVNLEAKKEYDLWAQFLILKVLIQYYDVAKEDIKPAILGAVEKSLKCIYNWIDTKTLFSWGQMRWFEALLAILWLQKKNPQKWLIDLAVKLKGQGFGWKEFYEHWIYKEPTLHKNWNFMSHTVNNAMAIKETALWSQIVEDAESKENTVKHIKQLLEYNGTVVGVPSGDECLAGKNPTVGTELCAVVEFMFSLEVLLERYGDRIFGDLLEKIAFNALPATCSNDMWCHQYLQQTNQVECSISPHRKWTTNGPEANIFGVEPEFGCCTANMGQGWAKFAASLLMYTQDGGLAIVAYSPCSVKTEILGKKVEITLDTMYPFRESTKISVSTEGIVKFPLYFRIPEWCTTPTIIFGKNEEQIAAKDGYGCICKVWGKSDEFVLKFPSKYRMVERYNKSIAIEKGPLIYCLQIKEKWVKVNEGKKYREEPHCDWEIYPESSWNYALVLDKETKKCDIKFEEKEYKKSAYAVPMIEAKVKAVKVESWKLVNGSTAELPLSPVEETTDKEELVTLIPYGCTKLRIAEFPFCYR